MFNALTNTPKELPRTYLYITCNKAIRTGVHCTGVQAVSRSPAFGSTDLDFTKKLVSAHRHRLDAV